MVALNHTNHTTTTATATSTPTASLSLSALLAPTLSGTDSPVLATPTFSGTITEIATATLTQSYNTVTRTSTLEMTPSRYPFVLFPSTIETPNEAAFIVFYVVVAILIVGFLTAAIIYGYSQRTHFALYWQLLLRLVMGSDAYAARVRRLQAEKARRDAEDGRSGHESSVWGDHKVPLLLQELYGNEAMLLGARRNKPPPTLYSRYPYFNSHLPLPEPVMPAKHYDLAAALAGAEKSASSSLSYPLSGGPMMITDGVCSGGGAMGEEEGAKGGHDSVEMAAIPPHTTTSVAPAHSPTSPPATGVNSTTTGEANVSRRGHKNAGPTPKIDQYNEEDDSDDDGALGGRDGAVQDRQRPVDYSATAGSPHHIHVESIIFSSPTATSVGRPPFGSEGGGGGDEEGLGAVVYVGSPNTVTARSEWTVHRRAGDALQPATHVYAATASDDCSVGAPPADAPAVVIDPAYSPYDHEAEVGDRLVYSPSRVGDGRPSAARRGTTKNNMTTHRPEPITIADGGQSSRTPLPTAAEPLLPTSPLSARIPSVTVGSGPTLPSIPSRSVRGAAGGATTPTRVDMGDV